jgi:hypothetical protein
MGKGKDVVVSTTSISDELSESFATQVHRAMGQPSVVEGNSASSSAANERISNPIESLPLQEVHRDVVTSLAKEVPADNFDVPVMDNNESFRRLWNQYWRNMRCLRQDSRWMRMITWTWWIMEAVKRRTMSRVMRKKESLFRGSSWDWLLPLLNMKELLW